MKSPITIDFVNSIIIVNAAYAKKASNPFSQEYEQLQRVRADYPTYAVITRTIKKNSEKENNFPIIGYKQRGTKGLVWTKDRKVTE